MTDAPEPVSVEIAKGLRSEVEDMIRDDPRMLGIARYLASVEIFWSREIPTACAGHGFIFMNPDFWAKMVPETRNTTIWHEVWHLILKHLDRGIDHDPETYNQAGDYVINNQAVKEGFIFDFGDPPWFKPCVDPKYANMSTEQVYEILWEEKKNAPPPLPTSGKLPADGKPKHVPRELIDDLVKAAANAVAGNDDYKNVKEHIDGDKGKLEDLEVSLGNDKGYQHIRLEITNKQIAIKNFTYEQIFADYLIDPISGAKRSFIRPNRRMHGIKNITFRLPGRVKRTVKKNRLAHLIYALDMSGSINQATGQTFHDSVRTIKDLLNPALLTVLFWDTEIRLVKTYTDNQAFTPIEIEAGGCTKLDCVYSYAKKANPDAVVIFTDLCVIIPPKPKWHTIWLVPTNHRKKTVEDLYGDVYIIPPIEEK